MRVFAFAFNLKPQDSGVERDVNRSQGEVSQSQPVEEARKPVAKLIEKKINARVIPVIADIVGNPRIDVEFHWVGLDPGDATAESQTFTRYVEADVMTLDDVRAELGLDPHSNGFGRLPRSVIELAKINPFAFIDMAEMNEDERNLLDAGASAATHRAGQT